MNGGNDAATRSGRGTAVRDGELGVAVLPLWLPNSGF